VTEVFREQWRSWGGLLRVVVLSVSPLAVLVTEGSSVGGKAFLNKLVILGEIHWSAEVMIWDKFFTIRPVASWSFSAKRSGVRGRTQRPNGLWSIPVDNDWMTEISREQWFDINWFNWWCFITTVFEPFAFSLDAGKGGLSSIA